MKSRHANVIRGQSDRQRSRAVASCLRPVKRICVGVESRSLHVPILEISQQVLVKSTSILYRRALLRSQSNSVGSARKIDRRMACQELVVHSSNGYASCAGKNVCTVWQENAATVDSKYRVQKVAAPGSKVQSESTPVGRIQRRQAPSTW